MRPEEPDSSEPGELFRARLSQQLDPRQPLAHLAGLLGSGVFRDVRRELR
jgi:hypothetical protein